MYEETPLLMVNDDEGVERVATRFSKKPMIAVDTESDSMYHYREKVCLLQFSDDEGDVIIDPLSIKSLDPIGEIMHNRAITKIFHGSDYDVRCLWRDYQWEIKGLFDTQIAARLTGVQRIGLADLLDTFFGIPIDKTLQRHDWSRRPLEAEHLDYARGDTHYLLALHRILLRNVRRVGREAHLREECRRLSRKHNIKVVPQDQAYLHVRGIRQLAPPQLKVLRRLYDLRDREAQAQDKPHYKVFGDDILIELSRLQPTSLGELSQGVQGKYGLKRRYGEAIVGAVCKAKTDPDPPALSNRPVHKAPTGPYPARLHGRQAEQVLESLKTWRNALCSQDAKLDGFTTFSNHDLEAITRYRPRTLDELGQIPEVRDWQVRDHGQALLAALDKLAPEGSWSPPAPPKKKR